MGRLDAVASGFSLIMSSRLARALVCVCPNATEVISLSKVLLIVPAYNEESSILDVARSIEAAGHDYLIVNDGSTDGTLRILREHHLNHLNLTNNLGIGGAVQAGHRYAYENGYDIDIQIDGDGQHDVSYVPRLVEAIEAGADLAIGSRFVERSDGFQSTRLRRLGIRWLSFWIKLCSGKRIYDVTSGFRATGARAIKLFCTYYPSDYPEPESIVYARNAGLSVAEVPVAMHERQGGSTSIGGLKSIYYMVSVTLSILITKISHRGRS